MDTDDLSEKAYSIIVRAARECDTLKAELGALSSECENEAEWLERARTHLKKVEKNPGDYVEYWDLEEEEGITAIKMKMIARNLLQRVDEIQCR